MKKNLSILFVVLLGLSLFLAACGGGASVSRDPKAILGEWKSGEMSFNFFDDGSVAGSNAGQSFPGQFEYDGTNLKIKLEGAEVQPYTVEITGDTMTWTDPSGSQTFTKVK
jgi:hypothetical protein